MNVWMDVHAVVMSVTVPIGYHLNNSLGGKHIMEVVLAVVCVGVCGSIYTKVCGICHTDRFPDKEHMTKGEWKKYFNEGGDI